MIVDLGCGKNKHPGAIGIDRVGPPVTDADHVCHLGFEPIPLEDECADAVHMTHAIEHIPHKIYLREIGPNASVFPFACRPILQLLREIYRILKPQGQFHALTLCYPDPRCFEDPDHCSFWTEKTIEHFVRGSRPHPQALAEDEAAGLFVDFEIIKSGLTTDKLLEIVLRKPE